MDKTKRRLGVAALVVILVLVALVIFSSWVRSRVIGDFFPVDRSYVGPNIVASIVQAIFVFAVMAVLYPPLRHWIERELDHVHTKLDHLIDHNPNVEDLPEAKKGRPWSIHRKP